MKWYKVQFYNHKYNRSTQYKWFITRTDAELCEKVYKWGYEHDYRDFCITSYRLSGAVCSYISLFLLGMVSITFAWGAMEMLLYGELKPSVEDTIVTMVLSWFFCKEVQR